MDNEKYISIGLLAQETGLPKALLKRYAVNGKIPTLKTPKQLMFRLSAVQTALDRLANKGGQTDEP
jgi:hypothetical protein